MERQQQRQVPGEQLTSITAGDGEEPKNEEQALVPPPAEETQRRWTHVLPLDVRSLLVPFLPRGLRFLLRSLDEFARLDLVAAAEGTWALEYAAEEGRVDLVRELWAEHGRMAAVKGLMTCGARGGHREVWSINITYKLFDLIRS